MMNHKPFALLDPAGRGLPCVRYSPRRLPSRRSTPGEARQVKYLQVPLCRWSCSTSSLHHFSQRICTHFPTYQLDICNNQFVLDAPTNYPTPSVDFGNYKKQQPLPQHHHHQHRQHARPIYPQLFLLLRPERLKLHLQLRLELRLRLQPGVC
jgi:hypothetical protein